ncbi:class I SAM-dependent methyltransferase [Lyngbya confervoides]|uniref:Class I SAM-dependent methyltransferase n=1 Tax=Lyngbya confervoides BDU141951 TaxID=1574623 RepID=A0ABD4T336_9CYAN|nr:class I SAM-dependent methyltransferase [Lyngbya confervoides]MCM1983009.1 class I SAM-dependent methyltransferase [Lyngbya confervoides BDU141951]
MFSADILINESDFDLHWQMTNCERFALQDLLRRLQPSLSIEVGTYQGGSLQVLSRFSEKVISIDLNPDVAHKLKGKFANVEYRSGNSTNLLPELVQQMNEQASELEFILIDGDHSTIGVRRDIEALLKLEPKRRIVIVLHDSFNPDCREGMKTADWHSSPYVQWVELDFIPGVYHYEAYDTAAPRTMWGGFACAVLDPTPRQQPLTIQESQRGLFEAVFADSAHVCQHHKPSLTRRVTRRVRRLLK